VSTSHQERLFLLGNIILSIPAKFSENLIGVFKLNCFLNLIFIFH